MTGGKRRGKPITAGEFAWRTPATAPKTASATLASLFQKATEKRITLLEMAGRLGMSNVGIHHWKNGRTSPNIMAIEEFAEAVGCKIIVVEKD